VVEDDKPAASATDGVGTGGINRMLRDEKDLSASSGCLTGSQASFFQEMQHFNFLTETVVSDLKAGASLGRKHQVRIWSAECSTGEEPYSIAISLLEAFRDAIDSEPAIYHPHNWQIEVVASDTDNVALAIAAEGIYSEGSLAELSLASRKRYFLRGRGDMAGQVRVKSGLSELVRFQCVDLKDSNWAIEGSFDVIFFRNALNHFDRETQERLLRRMLRYLKPHGYLILGRSEQVPWLKDAVLSTGNAIHQLRPHGTARYTGSERRTEPRTAKNPETLK
jgi:chemotaxis protein methyltransferase CheR